MHTWRRHLISIRNGSPAQQTGDFTTRLTTTANRRVVLLPDRTWNDLLADNAEIILTSGSLTLGSREGAIHRRNNARSTVGGK